MPEPLFRTTYQYCKYSHASKRFVYLKFDHDETYKIGYGPRTIKE